MPFFPVTAHQGQPAEYPGRKEFEKSLARGAEGDDPVFLAAGECFRLAGLDAARYGTPSWNPLSGLIDQAAFTLLKEQLLEVLKGLTPREEKVLRLRFGLDDGRTRTLEEVGKEFNVTRERIRQIEAKALRKMRHPSRSKKLKDYLD